MKIKSKIIFLFFIGLSILFFKPIKVNAISFVPTIEIDRDTVWANISAPYIIDFDVHIWPGVTLTIKPGVIIKLGLGQNFNIEGSLIAEGESDQPIVFTSFKDDSYGSDSDNESAQPAAGDWGALKIASGGKFIAKNTYIYYGGHNPATSTGAVLDLGGEVSLDRVEIAYNLIGIESNGKGDFIVHNSRIYDNQQLGAKNIVASQASSSIQPIEAQNNWWGDNSGPQANNNPEGKGDKVIGLVLFDPWIGKNSSNLPVVFVPGIGACMNLKVLTDIEPWSFDWKLFGHYYDGFIKTMQTAGYKLNKNFFIACYDWRKTNGFDLSSECDSGEEYLRHWIGEAKKSAKIDQVILVAHSMGGLIARSYIQSQRYDNDVKKLIILGTPNHGSAEAYYPWEGG